jgi:hypothetical protein
MARYALAEVGFLRCPEVCIPMKRLALFVALSVIGLFVCGCQQSAEDKARAEASELLTQARAVMAQARQAASAAPGAAAGAIALEDSHGKALLTAEQLDQIVKAVAADKDAGGNQQVVQTIEAVARQVGVDVSKVDAAKDSVVTVLAKFATALLADPTRGERWGWQMANPELASAFSASASELLDKAENDLTTALALPALGGDQKNLLLVAMGDVQLQRARAAAAGMAAADAVLRQTLARLRGACDAAKVAEDAVAAFDADKFADRVAALQAGQPDDVLSGLAADFPLSSELLKKSLNDLKADDKALRQKAKDAADQAAASAAESQTQNCGGTPKPSAPRPTPPPATPPRSSSTRPPRSGSSSTTPRPRPRNSIGRPSSNWPNRRNSPPRPPASGSSTSAGRG